MELGDTAQRAGPHSHSTDKARSGPGRTALPKGLHPGPRVPTSPSPVTHSYFHLPLKIHWGQACATTPQPGTVPLPLQEQLPPAHVGPLPLSSGGWGVPRLLMKPSQATAPAPACGHLLPPTQHRLTLAWHFGVHPLAVSPGPGHPTLYLALHSLLKLLLAVPLFPWIVTYLVEGRTHPLCSLLDPGQGAQ